MAPPKPSSQFENQPNEKYQVMRSNIPSQPKNYYKVIQSHGLHEQQCLVSGKQDNKIIYVSVDTDSSTSLLDEILHYSPFTI